MEIQFTDPIEQLRLGARTTLHGEGNFAITKARLAIGHGFTTIFEGVIRFVVTDIVCLMSLIAFPVIALWLPSRM